MQNCNTNPPVEQEYENFSVLVNIVSTPSGAEIFIDGNQTGFITPHTISLENGNHSVTLKKAGYVDYNEYLNIVEKKEYNVNSNLIIEQNKIVLIEDFANTSCNPCVISNKIIHSLLTNTYGSNKIIAIKFPTNFPSPNDPFYKHNKVDSDSRINFYNVVSAPSTFIDGRLVNNSLDSNSVKAAIDQSLNTTPNFTININKTVTADSIIINIGIEKLTESGYKYSNLVLNTVLFEKEISFATPPGSNGETIFYDVMRKMLPNSAGSNLSSLSTTNKMDFRFSVPINSAWQLINMEAAAYIQNTQTKSIYQTNSTF